MFYHHPENCGSPNSPRRFSIAAYNFNPVSHINSPGRYSPRIASHTDNNSSSVVANRTRRMSIVIRSYRVCRLTQSRGHPVFGRTTRSTPTRKAPASRSRQPVPPDVSRPATCSPPVTPDQSDPPPPSPAAPDPPSSPPSPAPSARTGEALPILRTSTSHTDLPALPGSPDPPEPTFATCAGVPRVPRPPF